MSISFSDIIKTASLAWNIYQLGWKDEFNGSRQYQEFGQDFRNLAENLRNISRVVENAKTTWDKQSVRLMRSRGLPPPKDWDLSSLREIIGDYDKTLIDCQRLLEENHEFRTNRDFTYNIKWNQVIQPKVDHLRQRLASHNSKISILLRPLEFNLLSSIHHDLAEIHRDLADRIEAVHQSVLRLEGLLIPEFEQALSDRHKVVIVHLEVSPELVSRFRASAEKSCPDFKKSRIFPLQAGADAFVTHFAESTKKFTASGTFISDREPPPEQHLALLKCIWIMNCLLDCDGFKNAPKDSQWPGYVQQLNEDLSMECQRFKAPPAQRLVAPILTELRHDDYYNIWPGEDIAEYLSPHIEWALEEVLRFPMPSPSASMDRSMKIYWLGGTNYRLVESVEDKEESSSRNRETKMEIDLKTVNLTPLYAVPSSRPKELKVLLSSQTAELHPSFVDLKHLLRLQNLITGYKVYERYHQGMVTVSFFISGQKKPVEEHGRLQLWLPSVSGGSSTSTSVTSSSMSSRANSIYPMISNGRDNRSLGSGRYDGSSSHLASPTSPASPTSFNMSSSSFSPGTSRENISSYRVASPNIQGMSRYPTETGNFRVNTSEGRTGYPSSLRSGNSRTSPVMMGSFHGSLPPDSQSFYSASRKLTKSQRPPSIAPSTMTTSSSMSRASASSITTISTGAGKARLHTKPAKPLLVIFLKSKEASGKLALVSIQIDNETKVERERCLCKTASSRCLDSCIERSGGNLLAQRWDAGGELDGWNLAKLGVEQRRELPADAWNDVTRVKLKFDTLDDRLKFSGNPCTCKPRMVHDLSRCIREGHHGVFGVVKEIGTQRLRNYHQEREKAAKLNIVLNAAPEDEH